MSDIDPTKLKVAELRDELKQRGLDTKGNKSQLVKRLQKVLAAGAGDEDIDTSQDDSMIEAEQDKSLDASQEDGADSGEAGDATEPEVQTAVEDEAAEEAEALEEKPEQEEPEDAQEPEQDGQPEAEAEQAQVDETSAPEGQMDDGAPEEAEGGEDGDAEYEVMDSIGDDTEAPEADQKKDDRRKRHRSRSRERRRSRSRSRDKHRHRSRRSGSRSRSPMRRRSRSGSKSGDRHGHSRRSRSRSPRRDTGPPEVEENEDWISATNVLFDKYNCDLNLRIDGYKVCPITVEGFAFMWAGGRANYGVTKGKVAYQVKLLEQLNVDHLPPEETNRHVVRVGWSTDATSTQLGEEPFSYGYGGTGKASVDCKFTDYGERFTEGDVITAYVDFDVEPITISFAKNDKDLGKCFDIEKESLGEAALFPHILTKNTEFEINFGQMEEPPFPLKEGYVFINDVPEADRLRGSLPPAKKEDCEMIMMCGLPGAGKTYWAGKHAKGHPETKYNVLGTNNIIDKMKVMGLPRKRNYAGRWDVLIDKSTKCLNRLLEIAAKKKRNYILDQTNVYPSAQRRKMRPFEGFQRKAVVIVPSDEEFKKRCSQREKEEGKEVPDSAVLEMKANFQLPEVGPLFDSVEFIELGQEEAAKLVEEYNKEGRAALPPPEKRFRDRRESYGSGDRYGNRDYRGRDYRGPNRYDRDRGGRGGYGGYRDRDRGRGGYGGRGGYDRRSGGYMGYSQSDRERAKDYNSRSSYGSRRDDRNWNQGSSHHGSGWHNQKSWGNQGWGNQGSNWGQSGWGQQGSWGNQSSGWGQQGNWGNQWTGYNQGTGTQGGWNYNWNQGQWNYQQPSQNYSSWSGYGSNYQGHSK